MGFLEEIAQEIQNTGVDYPPPVGGLAIGEYLEQQDAMVVLYENGGAGPGLRVQEQPGVKYVEQAGQVIVRGVDNPSARAKAMQLWTTVFNGSVRNRTLLGTYYLTLEALLPPAQLQRDGQDRWYFFFNFRAIKEPS